MKKSLIYIFAIIISAVTMSSCREDENEMLSPYIQDALVYGYPSEQFKSIWTSMVTSYGMWGIDDTDWQAVYDKLYPEFQKLDEEVKAEESIETAELKKLYTEAFKTIRDHHLELLVCNQWTDDKTDNSFVIFPGDIEIAQRDEYHAPHLGSYVNNGDLSEHPIVQHLQSLGNRVSELCYGRFESEGKVVVISALIDGTIPYIYFSGFHLFDLYTEEMSYEYPEAFEAYDNFRINVLTLDKVDGVIYDVRDNGGGSVADEQLVLGLLLDKKVQIGYTRYKAGVGRYDYTPWVPFVYSPLENEDGEINVRENYENPIVVLCNLHSVSMSEISSMLTKNLPNGVVIGERTYGGHGQLSGVSATSYYAGKFGNAAGPHYCYMSDHTTKTIDGEILEGIGVTPDIEMKFNIDELTNGNDTWIDRAITYVKTGK